MSYEKKGHLDSDRLDSVTILPPPDEALSLEGLRFDLSSLRPNYIVTCLKDLQAPRECQHLDHLVDAVHNF